MADIDGNKRNMDDIPFEEILNAVMEVLQEQDSLSETDLVREPAKKFGFSRLGNVIENTVRYAIQKGMMQGTLTRLEKGNIALKEKNWDNTLQIPAYSVLCQVSGERPVSSFTIKLLVFYTRLVLDFT